MVEPDRQADLDRIAAEEAAVKAAQDAEKRAEQLRKQAQGRLERPR